MQDQPHILISGAGLAGSLMSIYLAKKGWKVDIYESREDMRTVEMSAGRSINLALSNRGIKALEGVDLGDEIMKEAVKMPGRMLHDREGKLTFAPYGKDDSEYINSISRAGLNKMLMSAAEREGVKIHFNQKVLSVDFNAKTITTEDSESGAIHTVKGDLIIGGDGAASAIRQSMEKQLEGYQSHVDWLTHGYKELTIPPAEGGGFRIEKHALHIWPRGQYMLIALPNFDGSFTCTLFFPNEGEVSFEGLDSPEKVKTFFEQEFADAIPHIPNLVHEFMTNPVGKLGTLKCFPWKYKDSAVLIGDAAHAVVPFYGQGMNASFEDCRVLNECIEAHGTDWEKVLNAYQEARKINGDAIGDLAVENYYEMRDHVADPTFRKKRALEYILESKFEDYHSKYSLVTFHPEVPYAVAKEKGNKQDAYLMDFCKDLETIDEVDHQAVYEALKGL
jgi:kynurenine 3-monooxygenase